MNILKKILIPVTLSLFLLTNSCASILVAEKEPIKTETLDPQKTIYDAELFPSIDFVDDKIKLTLKVKEDYDLKEKEIIHYKRDIGWGWGITTFILSFVVLGSIPMWSPYANASTQLLTNFGLSAAIATIDLIINASGSTGEDVVYKEKKSLIEENFLPNSVVFLTLGNKKFDGITNEKGEIFFPMPVYDNSMKFANIEAVLGKGKKLYSRIDLKDFVANLNRPNIPNNQNQVTPIIPNNQNQIAPIASLFDREPPEIIILEPTATERGITITSREEKLVIKGIAKDNNGVSQVLINGVKANFDSSNNNFWLDADLSQGDNSFTVEAKDTRGNLGKKIFVVSRVMETPQNNITASQPSKSLNWYKKQYALVVGVNNYKTPNIYNLKNAVNDAQAVSKMLKEMGFSVTELYDTSATRKNIKQQFSDISKKIKDGDSFIFYFAGHGQGISLQDNKRVGYIIPYDANINFANSNVIEYDEAAVSIDDIKKYCMAMKSKHIALLLDSCFSGLALKRSIAQTKEMNMDYYNDLLSRKSINILTAGDDQPVSDISPFTKAILEGLYNKGLDISDRDGYVTFGELASYVKDKVEKSTNRRQRPQFDNLSEEDGDFIFKVR